MAKKDALNYKQLSSVDSGITLLAQRFLALHPVPPITPSDAINLIAPKEDRDLLLRAPRIGKIKTYGSDYSEHMRWPGLIHPDVTVSFGVKCDDALMPRHSKLQEDADPELVEAITQWVNHVLTTLRDFGRVRKVVEYLNEHCTSAAQLRYLWPSVITLLKMREESQDLAEELTELKQPKDLPSLSMGLREACRISASTVTSALLLEEPPKSTDPTVDIYVTEARWTEEFATFRGK